MSKKTSLSEPNLHMQQQVRVRDKYEIVDKIGQGSYGEVWLVLPNRPPSGPKPTTKHYVLKRLDLRPASTNPSQNDIECAEREAKLLSTLKHPNIVSYIESFRSRDGFLNIVMAYCEGGDLYSKLKEMKSKQQVLAEDQIIEWFVQISMALQVRTIVDGRITEALKIGSSLLVYPRQKYSSSRFENAEYFLNEKRDHQSG